MPVCEVFGRYKNSSCSFPGLWRENSSKSKSQAEAEKQHSPQREGLWAGEWAQQTLNHWELVGTNAVGL